MDGDYVMMPGKKGGHLVLVDLRSSMYYHKNGLKLIKSYVNDLMLLMFEPRDTYD